jgi:glycosyltransferase involved in cell wall biosynthesis
MFDLVFWGLGTVAGLAVAHSRMTTSINRVEDSLADMSKIGKVTVLMPTLNEAAWIEKAVCSLRNQNIILAYPDNFEIVVVDSNSEDGTADLAEELADQVITTERGKLTAIDTALRQVDGDVIVAVDADSIYGANFVNLLLKHFENPEVVAVTGSELPQDNPFNTLKSLYFEGNMLSAVDVSDVIPKTQKMQGRGCAYRRTAYFATGGFNLSIDQNNLAEMMNEEEYGFWQRLKQIGQCVREMRASVRTVSRRDCGSCNDQQCTYCRQIESGQRF